MLKSTEVFMGEILPRVSLKMLKKKKVRGKIEGVRGPLIESQNIKNY